MTTATTTRTKKAQSTGAFFGDANLKRRLVTQIRAHAKADQLIKGTYGDAEAGKHFRGCAVGCALDSLNRIRKETASTGDHNRFPRQLGIPLELAYLIDHFFESLPKAESQAWPARVVGAMPVGANLDSVVPAMLKWTIDDPEYGWAREATTDEARAALSAFRGLVEQDWAGQTVSLDQWNAIDAELTRTLGAWAGARAGAYESWYVAASDEAIRQLKACKK